jgi:hypothetical protein
MVRLQGDLIWKAAFEAIVVGDDEQGSLYGGSLFFQQVGYLAGVMVIEGGAGLVGQDEQGAVDQGAGDGGALLFACAQLGGPGAALMRDTEALGQLVYPASIGGIAGEGLSQYQVFFYAKRPDKVWLLENDADVLPSEAVQRPAVQGFHSYVSQLDMAGGGGEQSSD